MKTDYTLDDLSYEKLPAGLGGVQSTVNWKEPEGSEKSKLTQSRVVPHGLVEGDVHGGVRFDLLVEIAGEREELVLHELVVLGGDDGVGGGGHATAVGDTRRDGDGDVSRGDSIGVVVVRFGELLVAVDDGAEPLEDRLAALEAVHEADATGAGADGACSEGGKRILQDNSRVYVRFNPFSSGRVHPIRLSVIQLH